MLCTTVRNAIVLPSHNSIGGVYSNGTPLSAALAPSGQLQVKWQAPYLPPEQCIKTPAIYCGNLAHHYGHFLLESLSRLWFAQKNPEYLLVWTGTHCSGGNQYLSWQKQIIQELLCINNPSLFITRPTLFDTLYIPEEGLKMGRACAPWFAEQIGRVPSKPTVKNKRIYISRSLNGETANLTDNESKIEELVTSYGYTIFHPEKYSVRAQCDQLSSADIIFGLQGSAVHTLLLLNDVKSKIFCIDRANTPNYALIADAKSLDYTLLTGLSGANASELLPLSLSHHLTISVDIGLLDTVLQTTHGFSTGKNWLFESGYGKSLVKPQLDAPLFTVDDAEAKKLYYLGFYHADQGNLACAIKFFLQGLDKDPLQNEQSLRARLFSGVTPYSMLKSLEYELMHRWQVHLRLCYAYKTCGDMGNALFEAERAKQWYPEAEQTHINLASLLVQCGCYDQALRALKPLGIYYDKPSQGSLILFSKIAKDSKYSKAVEKYLKDRYGIYLDALPQMQVFNRQRESIKKRRQLGYRRG